MTDVLPQNLALVSGLAFVLWLVSVKLRDASIVDPWWSIFFLLIGFSTWWFHGRSTANVLLLCCLCLWSVRLWAHLLLRARGKSEDPRYAAMREKSGEGFWWKSLFTVFLLQACLALVIALPLQLVFSAPESRHLSVWDVLGTLLFAVGFTVEVFADWQLQRFRQDPERSGVLRSGLWARSRHPNYFGEAVLWWGFGFFALNIEWGWVTLLSPVLMTFLLLRVSGVTMLDSHMRRTKSDYASYEREVPAFIPRIF